jgi:hypothetical protein
VYGDAIDVVDGDCEHVIRSGSTTTTTTTPPAAKLSIKLAIAVRIGSGPWTNR